MGASRRVVFVMMLSCLKRSCFAEIFAKKLHSKFQKGTLARTAVGYLFSTKVQSNCFVHDSSSVKSSFKCRMRTQKEPKPAQPDFENLGLVGKASGVNHCSFVAN